MSGCSPSGPQDSPTQVEAADHMSQIRQKTGGDYSKLTPEDKKWLLDQTGQNEHSAQMLLGPPKAKVGKPPTGGG